MSSSQPFTPKEIERLNRLEQLMKQSSVRLHELKKALVPGLHPHLWNELLRRVEQHESNRLKDLNARVDLKRALVRGSAWKARDGKLDCTWPGADDGKTSPKRTLPLLWIADSTSAQLKPHEHLHTAAALLLKVKEAEEPETERQRFEKRLEAWESLASPFLKKGKADRRVESFLSRTADQPIEKQAAAYQRFIEKLSQPGDATVSEDPDSNPRARDVAENLWFICQELRLGLEADTLDSESHFLHMNNLVEAVRLADRLKLVARKGNSQRSLKMLEKKGQIKGPFAEAVRTACEKCWDKEPGVRPLGKDVLEAMGGRHIEKNGISYVAPHKLVKVDWACSPLASFQRNRGAWAKEKGLKMSGSMRPKKGEELPKPEPE